MNGAAVSNKPPSRKFQFVGGALCLDFCNSVGGKRGGTVREFLNSFEDFHSWCDQAGLLDDSSAEALLRCAGRKPAESKMVLSRALELREAIYNILLAVAKRKHAAEFDLAILNTELSRSLDRLRISRGKNGFGWQWAAVPEALDAPLGPIADSAAELLTNAELLSKIRQCHGDNCGWLFIDSSRNHSRCWCDMRDCGNRAKVRRHRMRKR